MSLVRFDASDNRGPTGQLWHGVVDWVSGMNKMELGQRDFEDFMPFLGWAETSPTDGTVTNAGTQITSLTATPTVDLQTDRFGVINMTEAAGTSESVGLAREIFYDLQNADIVCFECRVDQNADADSPQVFAGFSDVADPDDVFASDVIASGSNQDTIGLRWNADETIDIVAVDDGTLTVLKDDIGVTLERTDAFSRLGLRIEKITATQYRLTPSVNGAIALAGRVTVLATLLPENAMRPVVATTVAATTAPSLDIDWIATGDK